MISVGMRRPGVSLLSQKQRMRSCHREDAVYHRRKCIHPQQAEIPDLSPVL